MMAGKAAKAARGGFSGGRPPYGFKPHNRELVADAVEQEIVALASQLAASGASLRAIGAHLDAAGYRPRDGSARHPNTIRRMVAGKASQRDALPVGVMATQGEPNYEPF